MVDGVSGLGHEGVGQVLGGPALHLLPGHAPGHQAGHRSHRAGIFRVTETTLHIDLFKPGFKENRHVDKRFQEFVLGLILSMPHNACPVNLDVNLHLLWDADDMQSTYVCVECH